MEKKLDEIRRLAEDQARRDGVAQQEREASQEKALNEKVEVDLPKWIGIAERAIKEGKNPLTLHLEVIPESGGGLFTRRKSARYVVNKGKSSEIDLSDIEHLEYAKKMSGELGSPFRLSFQFGADAHFSLRWK